MLHFSYIACNALKYSQSLKEEPKIQFENGNTKLSTEFYWQIKKRAELRKPTFFSDGSYFGSEKDSMKILLGILVM